MVEAALELEDWVHPADGDDRAMLALCVGPTLDVGCGPGRLTQGLAELGHVVLGIDVADGAIGHSVERGATAIRRDVFGPLPGEGRWGTALLADGSIGIGGNPVLLLHRLRELLDARGRVVAELAGPGIGYRSGRATLRCGDEVSRPFPWAVVGVDGVGTIAREAGLEVASVHRLGERWCVVLGAPT